MAYQAAAQRGEHRPLFVSVAEGYHGDTLGAVSVGGHRDCSTPTYRPILLETRQIPSPASGVGHASERRLERCAGAALLDARGRAGLRDHRRADGAGGRRHAHPRRGFLRGVRDAVATRPARC